MAEPRDPWQTEVCRLFASLRALGGSLKDAKCTALFTGPPDSAATTDLLRDLDVEVRQVTPIDSRCPHANKIRMLEQDDDVDWLLALDTDMLVTGDLGGDLTSAGVRLRVVDADPFTRAQWRRLYAHFELQSPRLKLRTTCGGERSPEYYNSGAVFVAREHRAQLSATWREFVTAILDSYPDLGDIVAQSFYTDQLALAIALASTGLPVDPLPIEVNTPTHAPIHRRWHPASVAPRLVHYHHKVDDAGLVLGSGYAAIDAEIDRANDIWTTLIGGLGP